MAKSVSEFPALSEVQQLSDNPLAEYCLPELLTLARQSDWDWLDMINTFYHVGQKQVCELQSWFSPIDQKPIAPERITTDQEMADEDSIIEANVISQSYQTKQDEKRSLTIASFNKIGQ